MTTWHKWHHDTNVTMIHMTLWHEWHHDTNETMKQMTPWHKWCSWRHGSLHLWCSCSTLICKITCKKCKLDQNRILPRVYQPRGDCFKNAGSPCRMIFWVILILILAGFCFLRLGTDRPKCLKINFLCGFSCDFAKYTFWTTCHTLCNVSNCLISKCLCSQCLQMLLLGQ